MRPNTWPATGLDGFTGQVLTVDGGVDVGTRPIWEHEK